MRGRLARLGSTALIKYGSVCQFDDARKEVAVAWSRGQLQEHEDRASGVAFFESDEVLRLWPDPRWASLRANGEPLTLAEAVALLVRGRPAAQGVWARLSRRSAFAATATAGSEVLTRARMTRSASTTIERSWPTSSGSRHGLTQSGRSPTSAMVTSTRQIGVTATYASAGRSSSRPSGVTSTRQRPTASLRGSSSAS